MLKKPAPAVTGNGLQDDVGCGGATSNQILKFAPPRKSAGGCHEQQAQAQEWQASVHPLWHNVKRSAAYHSLSLGARAALLELMEKYTGANNGMISMGVRELAGRLKCGLRSALNFLNELDDAGLAHPTQMGVWRGRRATEWRLTFHRCDRTGELPVLNWEARSECTYDDARVHPRQRKPNPSAATTTQTLKSSMNGIGPSAPTATHIDIPYPSNVTPMQQRARARAGIPLPNSNNSTDASGPRTGRHR